MSRHVHFLGICGYAVSGAALVAQERGYTVTGSDERAYPPMSDMVTAAGITWVNEHSAENLDRWGQPDLVVVGNQIRPGNVEWIAAQERHLPIVSETEFYLELVGDRQRLAVCGTHGKSTTTALLAHMLAHAGCNPGFRLGATSLDFGVNAKLGSGPFVFEGDEYAIAPWDRRPKFLAVQAQAACVTCVELDHPDLYPTLDDYVSVFITLAETLPMDGRLVVCADDDNARQLAQHARCPVITYGENTNADWQITDVRAEGTTQHCVIRGIADSPLQLTLSFPGRHNLLNATAALALAQFAGASLEACVEACSTFRGPARRFQVVGEVNGIVVVDDYAHHPTEAQAAIAAARQHYPGRRIVAICVPHTYSRTKSLLPNYRTALAGADVVIIGPIEAARERLLPATVTSEEVAAEVRNGGTTDVHVVADASACIDLLAKVTVSGDVVLCLSLGGFDGLAHRVLDMAMAHVPR